MIVFKQKSFSEFDAMRSLFVKLKDLSSPGKFQMLKLDSLLPVLKGNNVVIERFVISTGAFKRDTYRMYLKIGAKAKMPDEVRLPGKVYDKTLFNSTLNIGYGVNDGGGKKKNKGGNGGGPKQTNFSEKLFSGNSNEQVQARLNIPVNVSYEVNELLGDAINYDKKSRSLVLEFKTIEDAIRALNILPFGTNYKIYLLDINS